jgi:hypothetical protein
METIAFVRMMTSRAHGTLEDVMDGLTVEQLHHHEPGSEISSIAAIYLHLAMVNDAVTQGLFQGGPPLYARDGWAARIGAPFQVTFDQSWATAISITDPALLRGYGQAVQTSIDRYLAGVTATAADLDRVLETPFGKRGYGEALGRYYLIHTMQHTGEISALKGRLGLRALPR